MAQQYRVEQILRAQTFALQVIGEYLVVSGAMRPSLMADFIEVGSAKFEAQGQTDASQYLREMWAGGLNGDWESRARAAGKLK